MCCEKYRAQPVLHTLLAKLQYASEGTNCRIELQIRKYCTRTTETIRAGERLGGNDIVVVTGLGDSGPNPKLSQLISCHPGPRIKPKAGRTVRFGCKVSYSARAPSCCCRACLSYVSISQKRTEDFPSTDGARREGRKASGGERASVVALERKRRDSLTLQPAHLEAEREIARLDPAKNTKAQLIFL